MNNKVLYPLYVLCICLASFLFNSCADVENFADLEDPVYEGYYAGDYTGKQPKEIKIVTFNIEFAIEIEQAIDELKNSEDLGNADIIFFQEMDEAGTESIARELDYNYVYYPSSKNSEGQLFGLAVLSKWPLMNGEKIILPHSTPLNNRRRIAVTTETVVGNIPVRLYNIHPATLSVSKSNRREQFESVLVHLRSLQKNSEVERAIIAGDFNTDKDVDIDFLVDLYGTEGFSWSSEDVGHTYQRLHGLVKYTLDHIFSRGLILKEAGKPSGTRASDHLPVWAVFEL